MSKFAPFIPLVSGILFFSLTILTHMIGMSSFEDCVFWLLSSIGLIVIGIAGKILKE